jgi:hypothetical protein
VNLAQSPKSVTKVTIMDYFYTSLAEMMSKMTWRLCGRWCGDGVLKTCRWRGSHVALTWQPRGTDIAATWRWHGGHMALTWHHMVLTWLPCGADVAKFNTGIYKWWHHHIFSPLKCTTHNKYWPNNFNRISVHFKITISTHGSHLQN